MLADLVFVATMPSLKDYAERCRRLALTVRSDAVREQLLLLARRIEQQAAKRERQPAAIPDRLAG